VPAPDDDPVVALTYRATVDVPARFRKSKAVGAVFGLTCAKYQSGEVDRNGRISRSGDVDPPIANAANLKSLGHLPAPYRARLYVCAALYSRYGGGGGGGGFGGLGGGGFGGLIGSMGQPIPSYGRPVAA
jgi:hypothetical protein